MITGTVNADLEATVPIDVIGTGARRQHVVAVIDTGFTGFLTLPRSVINLLQLMWLGREQGVLANGNAESFDVYRATLTWDGQPRAVEVQAVSAEPLIGMGLLEHRLLQIEVVPAGSVRIKSLP